MSTKPPLLWSVPVRFPGLESTDLHLWCGWLDDPAHRTDLLQLLLTPDELKRAGRFHFERDRRRFVAGRAMLRQLLGAYVEDEPAALRFVYGPYGKPALSRRPSGQQLQFNVTHSGPIAVYAFARGTPVGIDVEEVRELNDIELIAGQFFSSIEVDLLRRLDPADRRREFLRLWTQREAFGKARGVDLDQALTLNGTRRSARIWQGTDDSSRRRWQITPVRPASNYVGSVAYSGERLRMCCWQWPSTVEVPHASVPLAQPAHAWRTTAIPAA